MVLSKLCEFFEKELFLAFGIAFFAAELHVILSSVARVDAIIAAWTWFVVDYVAALKEVYCLGTGSGSIEYFLPARRGHRCWWIVGPEVFRFEV